LSCDCTKDSGVVEGDVQAVDAGTPGLVTSELIDPSLTKTDEGYTGYKMNEQTPIIGKVDPKVEEEPAKVEQAPAPTAANKYDSQPIPDMAVPLAAEEPKIKVPEKAALGPQEQKWENYTSGEMSAKEKDFLSDKKTSQPQRPSTLNTGFQAYSDKHAAEFDEVKAMVASDGWTLKKTVDTVDIFTKQCRSVTSGDVTHGSDMLYTKGVTTIKTYGKGIRHLLANMLTAEDRPQYDEVCGFGETVESVLPYYRIVYFQIKAPAAIIAPRDVLTLSRIRFEEDGSMILATSSCDHASKPSKSPHVRCMIQGGYVISPTSDPDAFQVTFVVSADPGGWLPGWVKNLIAWKSQLVLANFRNFYEAQTQNGSI